MPTDGPTAKFLYSIIKQLDLKSASSPIHSSQELPWLTFHQQIDWNLVANQLEISNGHAARMRYSRFRQQMEGTTSTPRGSRPKKVANKGGKGNPKADLQKGSLSPQPSVKQENGMLAYQSNPMVKHDPYMQRIPDLGDIPYHPHQMSGHSASSSLSMSPYPPLAVAPTELGMQSSMSPYSHGPQIGFERHHASPHPWGPFKMEHPDVTGMPDRYPDPRRAWAPVKLENRLERGMSEPHHVPHHPWGAIKLEHEHGGAMTERYPEIHHTWAGAPVKVEHEDVGSNSRTGDPTSHSPRPWEPVKLEHPRESDMAEQPPASQHAWESAKSEPQGGNSPGESSSVADVWQPVKLEREDNGGNNDVLVKVEPPEKR